MFISNKLASVKTELAKLAGKSNVFYDNATRALYCYDSGLAKALPQAVINIIDRNKISSIVKFLYENDIPFIARGAGTNLSGGTIGLKGGVILNLAPLNKILQIDTKNEYALVEPGVVNDVLQAELEKLGFFYAPDPASQKACTIGGNFAENAGGPRCLKYGVTLNNVLSAEFITPTGDKILLDVQNTGPDILALLIGSEGTLGIASVIKLKIIKKPLFTQTALAGFDNFENAMQSVSDIIQAGVIPSTIEAMDKLTIEQSEKYTNAGYSKCEAVLLMEFDGNSRENIEREIKISKEICRRHNVCEWIFAKDETSRKKLWQGRKGAFAAMARLAPNVSVEDGVVPRPKLAQALIEIRKILNKYNLKAGIIFHAGDGNIHPNIILDERNPHETAQVKKASREILKKCIELGGALSGEHGIGAEKRFAMNWLYTKDELEILKKIKKSFDSKNLCNPDKIIPVAENKNFIRPVFFENSTNAKEIIKEVSARYASKTKSTIVCHKTKIKKFFENSKILNLSNLNSILNIDKPNYTLTTESGIKINDLHETLKKENVFLSIPKTDGSLGGLISCKTYYPVRDLIVAMTLLFANGKTGKFGVNTVKNVSGYDIAKLIIGSYGSYAIILNVTLKLSPEKMHLNVAKPDEKTFTPDKYQTKIKKSLDEYNLLNPHNYENGKTNKK